MPDTPLGITYPESSDHTRLWEHLQTLAESADDAIQNIVQPAGPFMIQSGQETATLTNTSSADVTITYSPAFAAEPIIVVSATGISATYLCTVKYPSDATGCVATVRTRDNGAVTASFPVNWIAIGMPA